MDSLLKILRIVRMRTIDIYFAGEFDPHFFVFLHRLVYFFAISYRRLHDVHIYGTIFV